MSRLTRRLETLHNAWEAMRAAVLMTPRCRVDLTDREEGVPEVQIWECDRCGGSFESEYGCYEYCPRCGAKVASERWRGRTPPDRWATGHGRGEASMRPRFDWGMAAFFVIEFLLCVLVGYVLCKLR